MKEKDFYSKEFVNLWYAFFTDIHQIFTFKKNHRVECVFKCNVSLQHIVTD